MKKAQIGQIIVYLLAIVILAMVLIFGYRAVVNLRQQTGQAAYLSFQKGLEADINSIYFDYGSIKEKSYSIRGYKEVCFADWEQDPTVTEPPIVINSIKSKIKKNVFLVNGNTDSFYVEKIEIPSGPNPLCISLQNGKLNIKLTGQGDSTLVEEPQP